MASGLCTPPTGGPIGPWPAGPALSPVVLGCSNRAEYPMCVRGPERDQDFVIFRLFVKGT